MEFWQEIGLRLLLEGGKNPFYAAYYIFRMGGGLVLIPIMIIVARQGWLFWIQEKFKHHTKHTLYRVEVPQNNEQSMKAVEQIFVHIYGTRDVADWWQKWIQGYTQETFSFEIVSDGGYITYYVRTPTYYKEIMQAAFYAQYPDAVLTEVEDYTKEITVDMINEEKVKVWGSEMYLKAPDTRPIKSWPHWEHQLPGRAVDPLASILEFMSRLQPGEKLWYQIMATPADLEHFKHLAKIEIDNIVEPGGAHLHSDNPILKFLDKLIDIPINAVKYLNIGVFGGEFDAAEEHHDEGLAERQRLTTPEREFVEEIDRKSSRWVFETKVRFMYFAAPKIYDGKKARRGMLGGLALYGFINTFGEGKVTRTDWGTLRYRYVYPRQRLIYRARKMFWAYRSRDPERGEHEGFHMCTEELASLFHFPQIEVRAPFVAKSVSRGVEPPTSLRFDLADTDLASAGPSVRVESSSAEPAAIPTVNIVSEAETQLHPGAIPPGARFFSETPVAVTPEEEVAPEATVPTDSTHVTIADETESSTGTEPPSNLPVI